jgi:mannose-6-phosphate isomerase
MPRAVVTGAADSLVRPGRMTLGPLISLEPHVRNYAWGSVTRLPEFTGAEATGVPVAEHWFGAHPQGSSKAVNHDGSLVELRHLISSQPELTSDGAPPAFLVKLIAVDAPLSIQVHPDTARARLGFAGENAAGIPVDASERSFKDPYGKPEVLIALDPFRALAGLRPTAEIQSLLAEEPFSALAPLLDLSDNLGSTLGNLMTIPAELLTEVLDAARALIAQGPAASLQTRTAELVVKLANDYPADTGVLVAALLNDVMLEPGDALFIRPGVPHAYLSGLGLEVMGNSDNVIRGGLTAKHVNAELFLELTDAESTAPAISRAGTGNPSRFNVSLPGVTIDRFDLDGAEMHLSPSAASVCVAVGGSALLKSAGCALHLSQGQAAFVAASAHSTVSGNGVLIRTAG